MKQEIRFYATLIMGFALLLLGFFTPPPGIIDGSVLFASGILFSIGSLAVGIDIKGIIHEFRLLKQEAEKTPENTNETNN